jgi:hypothetical protein
MSLRTSIKLSLRGWVLALLCPLGLHASDGFLKGVSDPTRPPAVVKAAMAGPDAAASAASAPPPPPPHVPVLGAIRYDRNTQRGVALIDDQLVNVGDKVGDDMVTAITHDTVTLKGPAGTQRLSLLLIDPPTPSASTPRTAKKKRSRKEAP